MSQFRCARLVMANARQRAPARYDAAGLKIHAKLLSMNPKERTSIHMQPDHIGPFVRPAVERFRARRWGAFPPPLLHHVLDVVIVQPELSQLQLETITTSARLRQPPAPPS